MTRYAAQTTVSSDQSRAEIERTLRRYGADQFMYGWEETQAVIAFRANGRQIKFVLPLPDKHDPEFTEHSRGYRTAEAAEKLWEQAGRQRWRALALVIKAKLEAVESGITEFEDEFMAHIVLPSGATVGAWMRPQIEKAYQTGLMPPLLPALTDGRQ
jgi:hypothetical protein